MRTKLLSAIMLFLVLAYATGCVPSEPTGLSFLLDHSIVFRHRISALQGTEQVLASFYPGVALLDFDNDDDLDVFVVNGNGFRNALFRNDRRNGFVDVATDAGVDDQGAAAGVAYADVDNDGDQDLFVATRGGNLFYENLGNSKFDERAARAGIRNPGQGAVTRSAAFADIDNDGLVDLFICNFGDNSLFSNQTAPNRLYHNLGHEKFEDITSTSGLGDDLNSFAAIFTDFNGDGFIDLIVGNAGPLQCFRNNGDLTFTDVSQDVGLGQQGMWMGLTCADYDNDGDQDLFVSNVGISLPFVSPLVTPPLPSEMRSEPGLFENNGDGTFTDVTTAAGLDKGEWGWSCAFGDYDNDGDQDLYYVQNFLPIGISGFYGGGPSRLYRNDGHGKFTEVTIGSGIFNLEDGRGLATGDIDRDGYLDLVETNNQGPFLQYKNLGKGNGWLAVELEGTESNRDGIGAQVTVTAGDLIQTQVVTAGSGFASQSSLWLHFGLGREKSVDSVQVRWPSGIIQTITTPRMNRKIMITEENLVINEEGD